MSKQTYPYYVPVKVSSGQLLKIYRDKKFKTYKESYNVLQDWFQKHQKSFYEQQYGILKYTDQYECKLITIFTKGKETILIYEDLGNNLNVDDTIQETT